MARKKKKKLKVSRSDFEMVSEIDSDPDLSWLGRFTDSPKGWFVDRQTGQIYDESGNEATWPGTEDSIKSDWAPGASSREFRYFEFGPNHLPHQPGNWSHVPPKDLTDVRKEFGSIFAADVAYAIKDWDWAEAINEGQISILCIAAKVDVEVPVGDTVDVQTIESGFVCGVDEEMADEMFKEQCVELESILEGMDIKVVP